MTRSHPTMTGLISLVTMCVVAGSAIAEEVDLNLFAQDAKWRFEKNTGEGSFEVSTDGDLPIGVMSYDFSKSAEARSGKYVLATAVTNVEEGAQEIRINVRSSRAQRLTFRINDDTGQTHQFKGGVKGTGDWETITIPLTRRLEHWGGAKDGKVHFPVKRLTLSVPAPDGEPKTGKVEYANAVAVTK